MLKFIATIATIAIGVVGFTFLTIATVGAITEPPPSGAGTVRTAINVADRMATIATAPTLLTGGTLAPADADAPMVVTNNEGLAIINPDGSYTVTPWENTEDCTILPTSARSDRCELLTDY